MRTILAFAITLGGIAGQANSAAPIPTASFEKFDLTGAPWGIANEMPCAEAREKLLKHGMEPYNFSETVKRSKVQFPKNDAPHAVVVTPGDYKLFPNAIDCVIRGSDFCRYTYRRKRDGRIFLLATEGENSVSDCIVTYMSFGAINATRPTKLLRPQDISEDWKHRVDLPFR